jgi:5'-nucleotidase
MSYRPTRIGTLAAYRVNGTPADCVALGTHHWDSVDLVLSGLNLGFNLGNAIWHSGTLAAAKQAVLLGVRGVALSVPAGVDQDFEPVKPWIRRVVDVVIAESSLSLVNVNLPREPQGLLWTRVSVQQYDGRIVPTKDPQGRDLFWFSVKPLKHAPEGTDRWAVEQNWISLTPLRIDLTDEAQLSSVEERRPLDSALALATSPAISSSEAADAVRAEEATAPVEL